MGGTPTPARQAELVADAAEKITIAQMAVGLLVDTTAKPPNLRTVELNHIGAELAELRRQVLELFSEPNG